MVQEKDGPNVVVHEITVQSGGFRKVINLICHIDGYPVGYEMGKWEYRGDEKKGHQYFANVCAYRCSNCRSVYYLPDVAREMKERLLEKRLELGMISRPINP